MTIPVAIRPRLGQLLRLLSIDQPGEITNAAGALIKVLAKAKSDIHDLAGEIENGATVSTSTPEQPLTWRQKARLCLQWEWKLTLKENNFLNDILMKSYTLLTEKQQKWLDGIYDKIEDL